MVLLGNSGSTTGSGSLWMILTGVALAAAAATFVPLLPVLDGMATVFLQEWTWVQQGASLVLLVCVIRYFKKWILLSILTIFYGGTFQTCVIPKSIIQESLEPLTGQLSQRELNMSFLDELRLPNDDDEKFFPRIKQPIYVRDCMRTVFSLFRGDADNKKKPRRFATAFIGSPGVGKSVLFFLAALYQAQTTNVVYCRRTGADVEDVSIFVMTPEGENSVRIWFNRGMTGFSATTGIDVLFRVLNYIIPRKEYYAFIDGPKHDDIYNILSRKYDYLCTSGGHPGYKSEENDKRLWVLDAWTKKEVISALGMMGYDQNEASDAYDVCGGRIRDILSGWSNTGFDRVTKEKDLTTLLAKVSSESATLYVQSSEVNDRKDSILAMFERQDRTNEAWKRRMQVIQIVDSSYLLRGLAGMITFDIWLKGYNLIASLGINAAQGHWFEQLIHIWLEKNVSKISFLEKVSRSKQGVDGLKELVQANVYWIPGVPNFPVIDSVLIYNNKFHAFQMTIANTHKFDRQKFKAMYQTCKDNFKDLNEAAVYFVIPKGTKFELPSITRGMVVQLQQHEVDTYSEDTVAKTLLALFKSIGPI